MKRIAVLTSGGDAPGMNAAVRAVVRTGIDKGWEVWGVRLGYTGLLEGDARPLGSRDVSGIIQLGGTFLGSARCPEFTTEDGRRRAVQQLSKFNIDALVVVGGNGSQQGAYELSKLGVPVLGIASTIDNDLTGADVTIGVDTALNVALEAIDRLKVTASSHRRAHLVEVMGRHCGYIALMTGIGGGAEAIVIPEKPVDPEAIASELRTACARGKSHALAVVAEGAPCNAEFLIRYFREHKERLGFELRATILGHVQRGGSPTAFDRLLATRLGAAATEQLAAGQHGVLAGLIKGDIESTPLVEVVTQKKELDVRLLELAAVLAK